MFQLKVKLADAPYSIFPGGLPNSIEWFTFSWKFQIRSIQKSWDFELKFINWSRKVHNPLFDAHQFCENGLCAFWCIWILNNHTSINWSNHNSMQFKHVHETCACALPSVFSSILNPSISHCSVQSMDVKLWNCVEQHVLRIIFICSHA